MSQKSQTENSVSSNPEDVYLFGVGVKNPKPDKTILGGKGSGLVEMASLGLRVPEGFIITTLCCNSYRKNHTFPLGFEDSVKKRMKELENLTKKEFGGLDHPLLVSVRSGAPFSMPGMMDTVLNLGLNDQTVKAFAKATNNERLAFDSYRRFIMMFGDIVKGIKRSHFEDFFEKIKAQENVKTDTEVSVQGLKEICKEFKSIYEQETKTPFPENVYEQLFLAIQAVFNSWDSERATLYRKIHQISDDLGTAVTVQTMVFGNKNEHSATGVGFTRDPATGKNQFYGEFLINAQGEEVVAGIRTPQPINLHQKEINKSHLKSLEELMPEIYQELHKTVKLLENHFKDMQDIEFTIDDGKLYMLQTRNGKRTGFAAVKMLIDMLNEHLIDEKTALKRIHPDQIIQLLTPIFDQKAKAKHKIVAKGLNAGPGAASGKVVLSKEKAIELKNQGIKTILVRQETSPDDFPGMVAADGILTSRGGSTSHAAVVARGMGKPCIVGCSHLVIDEKNKCIKAQNQILKEGDEISIDGTTGEVFFSHLETSPSEVLQVLLYKTKKPEDSETFLYYKKLMELSDKYRKLKIRTNADTKEDCRVANAFQAEGIGLCRTEHMFMEVDRLNDVRKMFFSQDKETKKQAIQHLMPHQKKDFIEIFKAMHGLPVTIRLLDPPLHEFLPHTDSEIEVVAKLMNMDPEKLLEIKNSLHEQNPMLGFRGCRLGIIYPDLTIMQTRAILEAATEVTLEGFSVHPEIMIPLVSVKEELEHQKMLIEKTAEEVFKEKGIRVPYLIGTMIELPRSALIADEIAKEAEFFSFGTNDLTQTTFGLSRDDSAKFIPLYIQGVENPLIENDTLQIIQEDPFQVIDRKGVGKLMQIALELGKKTRPKLKLGICGEHGGDASSVIFCHQIGLDYVSCSPYRIAVAKLAAAQANLET